MTKCATCGHSLCDDCWKARSAVAHQRDDALAEVERLTRWREEATEKVAEYAKAHAILSELGVPMGVEEDGKRSWFALSERILWLSQGRPLRRRE